jgi:hypothetical protein
MFSKRLDQFFNFTQFYFLFTFQLHNYFINNSFSHFYKFVLNIFVHFYKHLFKRLCNTASEATDCGLNNWCLIPGRGRWTFLFARAKRAGCNKVTISLCPNVRT